MSTQIKKVVSGPLTANVEEPAGVVFQYPDGKSISVLLSELSQDMITRLAVHGISQKLGDAYASASKQENPLGWAKEQVQEGLKQLKEGDWRVTTAGGPRATLLARALARATGNELDAAIEVVDGLDDDQRKALHKDPAIKQAKAAIKLEDAQKAAERAKGATAEEGSGADLGAMFSG